MQTSPTSTPTSTSFEGARQAGWILCAESPRPVELERSGPLPRHDAALKRLSGAHTCCAPDVRHARSGVRSRERCYACLSSQLERPALHCRVRAVRPHMTPSLASSVPRGGPADDARTLPARALVGGPGGGVRRAGRAVPWCASAARPPRAGCAPAGRSRSLTPPPGPNELAASVSGARSAAAPATSSVSMKVFDWKRRSDTYSEESEFMLHNLRPAPGSAHRKIRKCRGMGSGKGGPGGFGMRGQLSRGGSPTRPGFEGGQTPLYRRIPKLRGKPMGPGHTKTTYGLIKVPRAASFERGGGGGGRVGGAAERHAAVRSASAERARLCGAPPCFARLNPASHLPSSLPARSWTSSTASRTTRRSRTRSSWAPRR